MTDRSHPSQTKRKWWCPLCAVKRGVLVTAPAEIKQRPACPDCSSGMVRYGGKAPLSL